MLNSKGKRGHPYLVPHFRGKAYNFSPFSTMLFVGLLYMYCHRILGILLCQPETSVTGSAFCMSIAHVCWAHSAHSPGWLCSAHTTSLDPTPVQGKPGVEWRGVCGRVSMGSGHCAQPATLVVVAGQAAPGTSTGAGSMWGCGCTRCTAYSFFCRHLHLDKGNTVEPRSWRCQELQSPKESHSPGSGPLKSRLPEGLQLFSPHCLQCRDLGRSMFQQHCLCYSSSSPAIWWVLSSCPESRKNEVCGQLEGEQGGEELYWATEYLSGDPEWVAPIHSQVIPMCVQPSAEETWSG